MAISARISLLVCFCLAFTQQTRADHSGILAVVHALGLVFLHAFGIAWYPRSPTLLTSRPGLHSPCLATCALLFHFFLGSCFSPLSGSHLAATAKHDTAHNMIPPIGDVSFSGWSSGGVKGWNLVSPGLSFCFRFSFLLHPSSSTDPLIFCVLPIDRRFVSFRQAQQFHGVTGMAHIFWSFFRGTTCACFVASHKLAANTCLGNARADLRPASAFVSPPGRPGRLEICGD